MHVDRSLTVTRDTESPVSVVEITGSAAEIYLGLWNRGDELALRGDDELLARWRSTQRVRW